MSDPNKALQADLQGTTQAFARDMVQLRASLDGTLIDGFARAGTVLESGLQTALRKGSAGFADLGRVALDVFGAIAAAAGKALETGSSGASAGAAGSLAGVLAALGLPGRATGGPVSPGRPYLVGENGPELFVPANAGRIDTAQAFTGGAGPREVRVAITIQPPPGGGAPQALQQSGRQIASAVRRALRDA